MLVLVAVVPLLVFFLWSPEHLKIFAYVPLLNRWVAPLGYRSVFALGGAELAPDPHWADHISIFVKRYAFWFLATVVIAWGWLVSRKDVPVRACPRAPLVFLGGLAIYALLWQVAILWRYPASVPAWATTFAPLWAVVLGVGASALLGSGTRPRVKTAVVVVLVVVFAVSPARARHPSMPLVPPPATTPTALAHDASLINAVMPPGARVFLVGGSMAPYLAGVSPYPQQIIHPWTLVPSTDERAISRSGLWGPRQIERWLSRDAPYAIIYPEVLHGWYGSVESYQPLVRQIEVLLDQHYVLVASHGDRVNGTAYLIYRRKAMTPQ
jgi:hypothetical protein